MTTQKPQRCCNPQETKHILNYQIICVTLCSYVYQAKDWWVRASVTQNCKRTASAKLIRITSEPLYVRECMIQWLFVTMGLERSRTTMMSSLSPGVMWLAEGSTMDIWVKRVNKKKQVCIFLLDSTAADTSLPTAHTSLGQCFSCLKPPEQLGSAWKNTQIYTGQHSTCLCCLCKLYAIFRLALSNKGILYLHSWTFWLHQNRFVTWVNSQ